MPGGISAAFSEREYFHAEGRRYLLGTLASYAGSDAGAVDFAVRKKGQFKDWSDLMARVKGIKGGAAARLSKEGLTVNGASYDDAAAETKSPAKKK